MVAQPTSFRQVESEIWGVAKINLTLLSRGNSTVIPEDGSLQAGRREYLSKAEDLLLTTAGEL
jgi:hypothetical protein